MEHGGHFRVALADAHNLLGGRVAVQITNRVLRQWFEVGQKRQRLTLQRRHVDDAEMDTMQRRLWAKRFRKYFFWPTAALHEGLVPANPGDSAATLCRYSDVVSAASERSNHVRHS